MRRVEHGPRLQEVSQMEPALHHETLYWVDLVEEVGIFEETIDSGV